MYKVSIVVSLFLLMACGAEKKRSETVLFAGEIVNPTSDYVVLFKGDKIIDSTKLDEKNRFSFSFDTIEEGLYHFYHRPEYQYIYLQEGDSIMARLNTYDFDESLVFSGSGEEINNFLLEMFLAYETDQFIIESNYGLDAKEFSQLVDSLRTSKIEILDTMRSEVDLSESMQQVALASIDYNYYVHKEKYPFSHKKKKGESTIHHLPKDFYDYRADLNIGDKDLSFFRPYHEFMKFHLGNLAYMSCVNDCGEGKKLTINPLHFNSHQLHVIDSLVTEKDLRDNLFRIVAIDYLIEIHDAEQNIEKFITEFHQLSSNNKHMNEIDGLYQSIKNLQPNKNIPTLSLKDSDGNAISLKEIAKNDNVVFYFWTGTQRRHFDAITHRALKLAKKYPEKRFVGINYRTDAAQWKLLVDAKGLDTHTQYRSDNFDELYNALVLNYGNKSIVCNEGVIVDGFADIYASF